MKWIRKTLEIIIKKLNYGNRYEKLPEIYSNFNGVGIPDLSAKLIKRTNTKAMYYRWDNVYEVFRVFIDEEKRFLRQFTLSGNFILVMTTLERLLGVLMTWKLLIGVTMSYRKYTYGTRKGIYG